MSVSPNDSDTQAPVGGQNESRLPVALRWAISVVVPETTEPSVPLRVLAERGYRPMPGEALPADPAVEGATVVNFDGDAGREHWLGYRNFYVITRYNRSPMYAMAVHQLAQAIRAGADAPAAGVAPAGR